MYIFNPKTKQDKQVNYVLSLKESIRLLEQEKERIDKKLVELRQKLEDNEDYIPEN
jgi:hypothetical protein